MLHQGINTAASDLGMLQLLALRSVCRNGWKFSFLRQKKLFTCKPFGDALGSQISHALEC
jgi:hypothetical protein